MGWVKVVYCLWMCGDIVIYSDFSKLRRSLMDGWNQ